MRSARIKDDHYQELDTQRKTNGIPIQTGINEAMELYLHRNEISALVIKAKASQTAEEKNELLDNLAQLLKIPPEFMK